MLVALVSASTFAQTGSWTLWASGLPTGVYPRMTVAPDHSIYYTMLGAGLQLGIIQKANTQDVAGDFNPLPIIPRPITIQNNIVALGFNADSEPLAAIYRTEISDPWMFRLDKITNQWDTAFTSSNPTLGGDCIVTAKEGTIYAGTKWSYIYKSTDGGRSFSVIDDTKAISTAYPCYYPTWNGSDLNGAIFSMAIDGNGRVYAGTETAGVIFSDDDGEHWQPADFFACKVEDQNQKDSSSAMIALAMSGNVGAIGFTKDNQVVWSGPDMWTLNWKNKMGFADMDMHTTQELEGLPDYLVQTGQQVARIVTTVSGRMFFHSGASNGAIGIGIYTSTDGIHWVAFNDGITSGNDGLSSGGLAVDGNKVFFATHDGKVWMYEDSAMISGTDATLENKLMLSISPNPASGQIEISWPGDVVNGNFEITIFSSLGQIMYQQISNSSQELRLDVSGFSAGIYFVLLRKSNSQLLTKTFTVY